VDAARSRVTSVPVPNASARLPTLRRPSLEIAFPEGFRRAARSLRKGQRGSGRWTRMSSGCDSPLRRLRLADDGSVMKIALIRATG
jgi:hypothetical protein